MIKDLKKKTFKGFFWQLSGALFKTFLQLFVLGFLARLITKSDFGVMQAALIVIGFAQLISQMGVGPALVQKEKLTEKHIRAGSTFTIILSFILFATVYFSSGLFAVFFKMPDLDLVLKVTSIMFILEGINTISQSLLLRDMKQATLVKIDFLSYLIGYGIVAVAFAYYEFGLWSLIFGQLAQSFIKCISTYFKSKHSIKLYWGKELKELLHFGGGFTLAHFFNYVANQGDNIVAGRYLGADALGIYSRAYSIMVKPVGLLGNALDSVLFPAMSARQGEKEKLKSVFLDSSELIIFMCLPVSGLLFLSSDLIVNILLGENWQEVVIPLQVLSIGLVFRMGYKMGSIVSKATGHVYGRAKVELIYATCVVCFGLVGVTFGLVGIAVGTLAAIVITYILMINLSLNILNIKWSEFIKKITKNIHISIILIIFYTIVIDAAKYIFSNDLAVLILSYFTCAVLSMLLIFLFLKKLTFLNMLPLKFLQKSR